MTTGLGWAVLGLGVAASLAGGQVVERETDTKVTGPRGRTIERDVKVERGPGFVDRQVQVKRPGETIIRDTRTQFLPGGGGRPFGPPYAGPRYYGGPRIVENVIVQRPPVVSAVVGLPALGFFFGGGGGGPVGVGGGGPVGGPPPGPQPPPPFDAFADAVGRLKSFHASSRRDGALTLGRIGDPRAIPALNERLEHDFDKDVRVASAVSLGQIGDERGAVALEKAALYDKRHEVRDAAKVALKQIPRPGELPSQSAPAVPGHPQAPSTTVGRPAVLDPGPPATGNVPLEPPLEDRPPPPPVPAAARAQSPVLEPPASSGAGRSPN